MVAGLARRPPSLGRCEPDVESGLTTQAATTCRVKQPRLPESASPAGSAIFAAGGIPARAPAHNFPLGAPVLTAFDLGRAWRFRAQRCRLPGVRTGSTPGA